MSDKILDLVQKHWNKPEGLVFFILLAIIGTFSAVKTLGYEKNHLLLCAILFFAIIIAAAVWLYSNKLPKNPKNKVGLVVCIHCYDEDEKNKIKEDFIDTLKKSLKDSPLGKTFNFLDIPDHFHQKVEDDETAIAFLKKTRSHFIIYGRVRKRSLDNKDHHFLELDGAVSHKPIPSKTHEQFAKEFGELFPKKINFPVQNDLLSFDFTSELIGIVVQYILGVAAAVSFDLDYSESLFRALKSQIGTKGSDNNLVYDRLRQRIPMNIVAISAARSRIAINRWFKDHNSAYISQITEYLEDISKQEVKDDHPILIIRGIEAFLARRDVSSAKNFLKKCKGSEEDPIWQLNLAFLHAYEGDLKTFTRKYRDCEKTDIDPITIDQIENFFVWILEEEPDKFQFHYCLGYFNWKIKGDAVRASLDFNDFLGKCPNEKFTKEVELTKKWLKEINASRTQ